MDPRRQIEALELVASELSELRSNDDAILGLVKKNQIMLTEILQQLAGYSDDHEQTALRLSALERQIAAQ